MDPLKKKFHEKSAALRTEIKALLKEHGDKKVDEVVLRQVFGGARGIKMMVWELVQNFKGKVMCYCVWHILGLI